MKSSLLEEEKDQFVGLSNESLSAYLDKVVLSAHLSDADFKKLEDMFKQLLEAQDYAKLRSLVLYLSTVLNTIEDSKFKEN